MTTRAELQGKSIRDLRQIAEAVGIETDGLQKAHLIDAIMNADGYEPSGDSLPVVELPAALPRPEPFSTPAPEPTEDDSVDDVAPRGLERRRSARADRSEREDDRREWDGPPMTGGTREDRGAGAVVVRVSARRVMSGVTDEPQIPEGDLEIREGILDILPEGYGFLRVDQLPAR